MVTLSIEGNIGAGKSTLLRVLEEHFGKDMIEFIPEPVELWRDCHGENLLEAFYKEPERYSYMFQSTALASRLILQCAEQKTPIRILERSGVSDHCFAENCYATGLMNSKEFAAYKLWYSFLINNTAGKPNGIIYLRTSPEVCFQRMENRNRDEESSVPLAYLKEIHDRHESWLSADEDNMLGVPVIKLDGDKNFSTCPKAQKEFVTAITDLLVKIN